MDQVAVVIGGGQTSGEFLCRGLVTEGYRVTVVDTQNERASHVVQEVNTEYGKGTTYDFGTDTANEASVTALVHRMNETFMRVDLLVYSIGIVKTTFISDFVLGGFDRSPQVSLVGYSLYAREFSRLMVRDGTRNRVTQVNSRSGKVGNKHNSDYSAAEFGSVGLIQSLTLGLAEYGITVHPLVLGNLLKSPIFQSLLPQHATKLGIDESEAEQHYTDKMSPKHSCDYQGVLSMLTFYVSPQVSYYTGQLINVINGQVMLQRVPGWRCAYPDEKTIDTVTGLQRFWLGKNICFVLIPSTLRSRYFFCVMALIVQGAHRGRPVIVALYTPGFQPSKPPPYGTFDLSRQAPGWAEIASL